MVQLTCLPTGCYFYFLVQFHFLLIERSGGEKSEAWLLSATFPEVKISHDRAQELAEEKNLAQPLLHSLRICGWDSITVCIVCCFPTNNALESNWSFIQVVGQQFLLGHFGDTCSVKQANNAIVEFSEFLTNTTDTFLPRWGRIYIPYLLGTINVLASREKLYIPFKPYQGTRE